MSEPKVDLAALFRTLQAKLEASLGANREIIIQSTAAGDAAEVDWRGLLTAHLPSRYSCVRGSVVDCKGAVSDTVDVIIYDRQYTPLLFQHEATTFVPAESVYAVFEVKQGLDKANIEYAGQKARSVRALERTSAPIHHAGGVHPAKEPGHIVAGILTLYSDWTPPMGDPLRNALLGLGMEEKLDIGCAIRDGAFCVLENGAGGAVEVSAPDQALLFFFIRLLEALRPLATAPAIEFSIWTADRMPTSFL